MGCDNLDIDKDFIMPNFNQVILMGNLTRDPNLSYTTNKTPVTEFGLAVNRKFKKADETTGEEKLFIECRCFGKRAETISKYFSKGNPIFVLGRLRFETWDQAGEMHSKILLIVESFEFIGKKPE